MHTRPMVALCSALFAVTLAACEAQEARAPEGVPATEPPAATPDGRIDAPVSGAALGIAESPEHGRYLADADGRALYLLEGDGNGESRCQDACAAAWPPYLAPNGTPAVGDQALQASLLGTLQRRDGTLQVTYNGHPLYYYARDQARGQTTGQDVTDQWGEWYLVSPQGAAVEHGAHGQS